MRDDGDDEEQAGVKVAEPVGAVGAVGVVVAAPEHAGTCVLLGVGQTDVGVAGDCGLPVGAPSTEAGLGESPSTRERGAVALGAADDGFLLAQGGAVPALDA